MVVAEVAVVAAAAAMVVVVVVDTVVGEEAVEVEGGRAFDSLRPILPLFYQSCIYDPVCPASLRCCFYDSPNAIDVNHLTLSQVCVIR